MWIRFVSNVFVFASHALIIVLFYVCLVHVPGSSTGNESQRRADTPSSVNSFEGTGKGQVNGTGTSTPTSLKGEGQLLECVSCQRMARLLQFLSDQLCLINRSFFFSSLHPIDMHHISALAWGSIQLEEVL